jgi:hypothetical protein
MADVNVSPDDRMIMKMAMIASRDSQLNAGSENTGTVADAPTHSRVCTASLGGKGKEEKPG